MMSLMMNLFFSLDVILIITYPFANSEKRLNIYLLLAIVNSLVIVSFGEFANDHVEFGISSTILYLTILAFWFVSFASIMFALVKLCKPGISEDLRKMVVRRHILSVITFVVTTLYIWVGYAIIYRVDSWH